MKSTKSMNQAVGESEAQPMKLIPLRDLLTGFPTQEKTGPARKPTKPCKKSKKTNKNKSLPALTPFPRSRTSPPHDTIKTSTREISALTGEMKDNMGELIRLKQRQDQQERATRGQASNYTRMLERFSDGRGQDDEDGD